MSKGFFAIIISLFLLIAARSFTTLNQSPGSASAAKQYDKQLSLLNTALDKFELATNRHEPVDSLKKLFFNCRLYYKSTELFIDAFLPFKARQLNGPDLLKIEEENPTDSLKPHGFQVLERMLFTSPLNYTELSEEVLHTRLVVQSLQNDQDRKFYFTDTKIWWSLRLGVYRIVSLGVTGFDVPLTYHALPETKSVLRSVQKISSGYYPQLPDNMRKKCDVLVGRAISYLNKNTNFNKFDRLTFIKDYINPISDWLTQSSIQLGYLDTVSIYPFNVYAGNLFSPDIFDPAFFYPTDRYKVTNDRVRLGKKLFYDPILSRDGKRSCATCHMPEKAFTDGTIKSPGIDGITPIFRNTPTLWNASLQTNQFYDSRTRILEDQLSSVVHNKEEMNGSLIQAIPRLAADSSYNLLFTIAYPLEPVKINEYDIANAVSSYIRTLISFNSPFDKYMRGDSTQLSTSAKNGFNLFMGKAKCGTCHYAPLFNGLTPPLYQETESETLAVPKDTAIVSELDADEGRYRYTRHPFHKYSFRTSGIRNVALTAPYMHNGAFPTLLSLINFYNDGGGSGRGISLETQTLPTDPLHLSEKEKEDIIAFLNSLTDTSGTSWSAVKKR